MIVDKKDGTKYGKGDIIIIPLILHFYSTIAKNVKKYNKMHDIVSICIFQNNNIKFHNQYLITVHWNII